MAKLLITGALGHIGSGFIHSVRPGEFEEVVLLDDLSTQRYCSLFNLPGAVPFRLITADILTADLDKHLVGIDVVVHLAAATDAEGSFDRADAVDQVNYEGTVRVAKACAKMGTCLLFLSTTSVYGSQGDAAVDEECPTADLRPQSPYATAKLKAEQYLDSFSREGGLRFVTCRVGTIFGTSPGMRFHTAINKFCWQAVVGEPLTVWRTAMDQMRPYAGLSDTVEAIRFILKRQLFDGRVYNVVTLNASVRQIVEAFKRYVPGLALEYVDSPVMNQLSYRVSNDRFTSLGFRFKSDLEQGIRETIQLLQGVGPAVRIHSTLA